MAANESTAFAGALYEADFLEWTEEMARRLESCQTEGLDWQHLAEEIRDLGNSQRNALCSHLGNLLLRLIKWEIQPERRGRSWEDSISNSRREIDFLLDRTPSLNSYLASNFDRSYERARRNAFRETHLPLDTPCTRWNQEQALDLGFLPD
jgi:hypothetical protein